MSLEKQKKIIAKLKKEIKEKGYYEDLGQKELREYREYVFNNYSYQRASELYDQLDSSIDNL